MIQDIDFRQQDIAQRALLIQKLAYRIEADLIDFDGIPQLHESIHDLQESDECFLGYFIDDLLVGMLSYALLGDTLDIGRLVVHPDYFRRGIARALVQHLERRFSNVERIVVSTGAENTPACAFYDSLGYTHIGNIILPEGVHIAQYEKRC